METKLIEFKNKENETLRGIMTMPDGAVKKSAVFLHGFERNATVEKKFKQMAGALAQKEIASFRFDASGCGLSDGDFSKTTVEKRSSEMMAALNIIKNEFGDIKISFVAHSLGACVLAKELDKLESLIGKIILIAPGLNQKDILRYYFARDLMKFKKPGLKILFDNYKQYFDENQFLAMINKGDKIVNKWNYIGKQYFLEVKDLDFSHSFDSMKNKILHVHGTADPKVPLESLGIVFPNRIIVPGGDHDLERPDFWEQWFSQAVNFLEK